MIAMKDVAQTAVVMRNEIRKFARGKKLLMFGILTAVVLAGITAIVFIANPEDGSDVPRWYAMFVSLLVLMAAALFSSTSIVSEFEERTALVLFTKPVKRASIFLGKMAASVAIVFAIVLIYYAVAAVVTLAYGGSDMADLAESMGLTLCYSLAAIGVGMLISSFAKKSSTATILTLLLLMLLFSVVSMMISEAKYDYWWMLDQLMNSVTAPMGDGYGDGARDAIAMVVWCIVTSLGGLFIFKRREF